MEFRKPFGRRKKSNPKRGLFLVMLLIFVLLFWFYAERIIDSVL